MIPVKDESSDLKVRTQMKGPGISKQLPTINISKSQCGEIFHENERNKERERIHSSIWSINNKTGDIHRKEPFWLEQ